MIGIPAQCRETTHATACSLAFAGYFPINNRDTFGHLAQGRQIVARVRRTRAFMRGCPLAGLAIWGKRAPLQAVLVALATYVVVIVTNAMLDPKTIAQGRGVIFAALERVLDRRGSCTQVGTPGPSSRSWRVPAICNSH